MRIGFYNPYQDTLGGAERYLFDIANYFIKKGHSVDFFWTDVEIKNKILERFNLNLEEINFLPNIFLNNSSQIKKLNSLRQYDIFFYITDGSLFLSTAKKNVLVIQSPAHIPQKTISNNIKMQSWNKIFCYSKYVKEFIDRKWNKKTCVFYPTMDSQLIEPKEKKDIILSVGRFTNRFHAKKQDILIDAFKKLTKVEPDAKLILAGGLLESDNEYFNSLKNSARGFNIEFFPNISFKELANYYGIAKIYWHAAGFGEDLVAYPERAEHFGITTIEAMSAGCVPIVFKAGGQIEIVDNNINGYFWQTEDELINITKKLLKTNLTELSNKAIQKSQLFNLQNFERRLKNFLCL